MSKIYKSLKTKSQQNKQATGQRKWADTCQRHKSKWLTDMKNCFSSLAIKKIQTKTTIRLSLNPNENDLRTENYQEHLLARMWGKWYTPLLVELQTGAATMEVGMENIQATENSPTIWPSNPAPGNIFKRTEAYTWESNSYPLFHCSTINNHTNMKTTWMPFERGLDKETTLYLFYGILFSY